MVFLRAGPVLERDADALALALVLVPALIDTETAYLAASWTLSPDRTMMCGNPEFERRHGHCGLAAEPGPRKV
jgi:hypothetical protein